MRAPDRGRGVFCCSAALIVLLVAWGLLSGDTLQAAGGAAFSLLTEKFGWLYVLAMTGFVAFAVWMGFLSPYRTLRLGPDGARPEYRNLTWFGMLFSAGMGIGLIFWGVAEPLSLWASPPGLTPGSPEAARFAFQKVFLHWGLHPWAGYGVLGLAMAYFQYRKGAPSLVSSVFLPLLGEKQVSGPIGKLIDVLAVFATAAGISTSLGLGALQIGSGLHHVFGLPESRLATFLLVALITAVFLWSAMTGLDRGIRRVSSFNMILAGAVLLAVFLLGPSLDMLRTLVEGLGVYLQTFPQNALETGAFGHGDWYGAWTVFYWAWWISWAPFSALFIARISKGRTVREFVAGVLLLPAGASFVWFSVFGTAGIRAGQALGAEAAAAVAGSAETALFVVLDQLPLGKLLSAAVIVLLCTFFITSANSATFVLGMLTSGGDLNPSGPKKLLWGVLQSALALVLLLCTEDGLGMLQTVSIVGAFPFLFVLMASMISLMKALRGEGR